MNSGFMRERVLADDRLVVLDRKPGRVGDRAGGLHDPRGVHPGREGHDIVPDPHGHHDFLKRRIACALAESVDGAFHLPGTGQDRGE